VLPSERRSSAGRSSSTPASRTTRRSAGSCTASTPTAGRCATRPSSRRRRDAGPRRRLPRPCRPTSPGRRRSSEAEASPCRSSTTPKARSRSRPGRGDLRYSSVPDRRRRRHPRRHARRRQAGQLREHLRDTGLGRSRGHAAARLERQGPAEGLPPHRRRQPRAAPPEDHPLAAAVVDPWDRGSQADLVMSLLGPLLVHGNGLTGVDNGAGTRSASSRSTTGRLADQGLREATSPAGRSPRTARTFTPPSDKMLHLALVVAARAARHQPAAAARRHARDRGRRAALPEVAVQERRRPPSAITADKEFLGLDRPERELLMAACAKT
jgi:hypothetical protein